MSWWQAVLLGIVEGLTEYLPVSSTGHLLLAQRLLGIPAGEAANAYAIAIQLGAIVAVFGLYRRRIGRIAAGLLGRDRGGRRLGLGLLLAFLPAALAGLLLGGTIERHLFGLHPVAWAWLVGGLTILVLARSLLAPGRPGRSLTGLSSRQALVIGLCQCLALWPGTSRSLATIVGGTLAGLSLPAAVELSFLLGLVTLGAATVYTALTHAEALLGTYGLGELLLGFAAAAVSAAVAVRWMVRRLERHGLAVFGWYRIALGLVTLAGLAWLGNGPTAPLP